MFSHAELQEMKKDFPNKIPELYDITQKTDVWTDGVSMPTWAVYETRKIEVQPLQLLKWGDFGRVEYSVGGQTYVPTFRGFISNESEITAANRITADSGTTNLLVLRVFEYADHKEIDLRDVED